MPIHVYFQIAFDAMRRNKVRSLLTMLGVVVGVLAVILLVSLGEAAQLFVEREFAQLGSNYILITPGKQETSGFMPLLAGSFRKLTYQDALQIERRARGVRGVVPTVMGTGLIRHEGRQRNCPVLGVTDAHERIRGYRVRTGRFISIQDHENGVPVCVLGATVYRELFGDGNALHERVSVNRRKFLVIGVLPPMGTSLGINPDETVFIPLSVSQQMFHGGEDQLFQILAQARTAEDVPAAMASIREVLIQAHDYTEDFTVMDQASVLDTFNRIFTALKIMLGGVASISLLVGGIGIMNIMLVSVRERTREVGVRKAVGARREDIGKQFLIEAIAISATGGVLGIVLGYSGAFIARVMYPTLPVYCSTWSVLTAFLFSVAVGVFSGVYPALKAAAVDPVEALRYE